MAHYCGQTRKAHLLDTQREMLKKEWMREKPQWPIVASVKISLTNADELVAESPSLIGNLC
jgi:hypothetical protein